MGNSDYSVLVLEDSPTQAERLRQLLAGQGYQVTVAANGQRGLELVHQSLPDLVISDVLMPELDGFSFCRAMKADEATRHVPLVLLTTENSPLDVIVGLERGAANFITKPYEPEYLLQTIARILYNVTLQKEGSLPADSVLHLGEREVSVPTDRQQIIELLVSLTVGTDASRKVESKVLTDSYNKQIDQLDGITKALDNEQFVHYYQPILDLRRDVIVQDELLLRMVNGSGQIIPPNEFLPLAEASGLISRIDISVLKWAIQVMHEHHGQGHPLRLSINISGKSLLRPSVVERMVDLMALMHIDPSFLMLEITETSVISDMTQANRAIEALQNRGCKFALDDFGVGFSSLDYLKRLAVDVVKIDGSFVRNLVQKPTDQRLVKAMTDMAHDLGKEVVAEFVGDKATLELLRSYEVDFGQGYLIGRPGPAPHPPGA